MKKELPVQGIGLLKVVFNRENCINSNPICSVWSALSRLSDIQSVVTNPSCCSPQFELLGGEISPLVIMIKRRV